MDASKLSIPSSKASTASSKTSKAMTTETLGRVSYHNAVTGTIMCHKERWHVAETAIGDEIRGFLPLRPPDLRGKEPVLALVQKPHISGARRFSGLTHPR